LQQSISLYYYQKTGPVFIGTLWAIGFFLLSYKGYERQDAVAGNFAWGFALGVSLCPTKPCDASIGYNETLANLHWVFAGLLFLTLSYFSLLLFTKTDSPNPTRQKQQRNIVYRACGFTMLGCIALVPIAQHFAGCNSDARPVFWLEAITIAAFGVSWLVKGEAILADPPEVKRSADPNLT